MAIFNENRLLARNKRLIGFGFLAFSVFFLVFFNLTRFPQPWFDEGSHLHVPKTLVRFGVYADYSSEGFRYYGPTIGVGPTVMLPIAGVFKLAGIGLLQARIVMAFYAVLALIAFYLLLRTISQSFWFAFTAIALLISSRSVLFLNYGRQVLGEVPGLFFLLLGIVLWFTNWKGKNWVRLVLVGLLFGLAMVTKYQYLLFLMPMIGIMWFMNLLYYKTVPSWTFIIPGVVAGVIFAIWQGITILNLGPATAVENLALLRASAEGAAFSFDPRQMSKNLGELTTRSIYAGALFPALLYGFFISIPRNPESQKWGVLFLLVSLNLVWYVIGSIGWLRYAFLGLALSSIFITRLFYYATDGFNLGWEKNGRFGFLRSFLDATKAFQWAMVLWLSLIILTPAVKTVWEIASPGPSAAVAMAEYLNENIPFDATIETWEPEMGFFTDHNYHYPPNSLLAIAVEHIYSDGEPVQGHYDFIQTELPEYLLVGEFSKWVNLYPIDQLSDQYELINSVYDFDLYKLLR